MTLYPGSRKLVEPIYISDRDSRGCTTDLSMAKIVVIENSFEERPVSV
jgi:hypothetical protein